ncbi:MAG: chloride channel protein [Sulfurimonas sp.]|nr:chloride channel protein [Sulfurimonas sp.]
MNKHTIEQASIFLSVSKWLLLSSFVGIIIGAVVTLFLNILQYSEQNQHIVPFPHYYLLPFGLVITVWLVRTFAPDAKGHGTEKVIEAIHKKHGKIEVAVIPIKLLATVITIFTGGSVGKEGPGAQIGAGMASFISELFHFSKEDRKKLVICGIGAGFAAVFGTPVAGAIFGVEVLIVGLIKYDVLLPSFIAGFAAFSTAQYLGIDYTYFDVNFHQIVTLNMPLIIKVIIAGLFFGLISDLTITFLKRIERAISKIALNIYIKAFTGGLILVALSFVFGDEYFGLGIATIDKALQPDLALSSEIPWYAFILKTIFTAITLGSGGSGGIVTPIFYIGATSGHLFGTIMGDHIAFFAAIGFVSVLAGTTNSPIAATIMAMELFGIEVAHYAAISIVISFFMTGHRSVFPSQILAMRKSDMLDIDNGDNIGNADVKINTSEIERINKFRDRLQRKRKIRKSKILHEDDKLNKNK